MEKQANHLISLLILSVLWLSISPASAATIAVRADITVGTPPLGYYYEGTGTGTYNTVTTEILLVSSGSGFTAYGGEFELQHEERFLGLFGESRTIACTPTDILLCTEDYASTDWGEFLWTSNTVNEFGYGVFTGVAQQPLGVTITYNISPVPIPAAAWLFGAALVGLAGLKHRDSR